MSEQDRRKPLNSIRSSGLTRGLSLLKASIKAGSVAAKQFIRNDMTTEEKAAYLLTQVKAFTQEIGHLKGSAMKVGQLLSTYGEHFLPAEANKILKSLQQDSPPVAWHVIEKQLVAELGRERLEQLEITRTPIASASIGQVHSAIHKASGERYAIKVQYPGVDRAIDSDLKLFKVLLSTLHLLPMGARMDDVFEEVRQMLHQEVDYLKELAFTQKFYSALKNDSRYVIHEPIPEFCTRRVMTSRFVEGRPVDSPEVAALSQERRNRLGMNYLELYLDELVKYKLVQTDPHFGNYRIQIDPKGENDRIVLFDFGAMREVPEKFLKNYKMLMRAGLTRDAESVKRAGENLNLLMEDDPHALVNRYIELCFLITEPFADPSWDTVPEGLMDAEGRYDWGRSDLPKRVATKGGEIALNFKLRSPPREAIFLDRKLGGVFIFLKVLGCKLETRSLLTRALQDSSTNRE